MKQAWRWFGPSDNVSINEIIQAGATDVVSALHHLAPGEVWTRDEIAKRKHEVSVQENGEPSGLVWSVIESLPVSEQIKRQTGPWREHIESYKESLRNVAAEGIFVVCYNFMPVLDWTRTDLAWRLSHGGTTMRFDVIDFAAYDLFILRRSGAENSYSDDIMKAAEERFAAMEEMTKKELAKNVSCGLPGATDSLTLQDVRDSLAAYDGVSPDMLRQRLIDFLEEVVPVAEELGVRLCCHPDDPPFSLLGLPRIMSTEDDYCKIIKAVDSPSNGITLCTGALGARADNDLPGMIERLGDRVHFFHLRNVKREMNSIPGSFHEAEHLGGDSDMIAIIQAVLRQEEKRREQGREDWNIPIRPDHGQDIFDDLERDGQPGYPSVGRLKGLAELRGVIQALSYRG